MRRLLIVAALLSAGCLDEAVLEDLDTWRERRPVPSDFAMLGEGSADGPLRLEFDVPEGVTSLEIAASTEPERWVMLTSLRPPSGELLPLLADGTFSGSAAQLTNGFPETRDLANVLLGRQGDGAFRFPNDATTVLEPGRWSLGVQAFAVDRDIDRRLGINDVRRRATGATVHARVLGREGMRDLGALDLELLIGPGTALSADAALESEAIMNALAVVDRVYEGVNIRVCNVVATDVPDLPRTLRLEDDSCNPSRAIRRIGRRVSARPGHVPIAFIGAFRCIVFDGTRRIDIGSALAGLSPGIPGIFTAQGEAIVVSVELLEAVPEAWARVLAHEIGHFLGLLHVVQNANTFPDNLMDTADGTGEGDPRDNLMFPAVDQIGTLGLTPQQGQVLRQSPYVSAP
ncbi:MAG: hypothetical protein AAF411_21805 [Myxococcota bacterium]